MSKKPAKTPANTKGSARPEPAQLKAVQRLLDARDYPRAIERARALVERFPDHGSANALLVSALNEAHRPAEALLAAWHWTRHRPRGISALLAFVDCAIRRSCVALTLQALERLGELGAETPSRLDVERLESLLRDADGLPMSRAEAERFETGKLHLEAADFAGVLSTSSDATSTPARNNLAVALFHLGRITEARDAFLDAWQRDPGNLFALGNALAMRLYLGDETGAAELAVPLAEAEPRRIKDAYGQLYGLLLIGEDQAAWDAFQRTRSADWAADADDHLIAEWLPFGGGAAARVGAAEEARNLWWQVLKQRPKLVTAKENIAAWEESGQTPICPAVFEWNRVLPLGQFRDLSDTTEQELAAWFSASTASNAYLKAVYLGGTRDLRTLAGQLLSQRLGPASATDQPERSRAGAAAVLRELACRPVGTDNERIGLLRALREADLLGADEAVDYWNGETVAQAQLFSTEIYRDTEPDDLLDELPDDLQALFDESIDLMILERNPDAAETLLQAILARVPDPRAHSATSRPSAANRAGVRSAWRSSDVSLRPIPTISRPAAIWPPCWSRTATSRRPRTRSTGSSSGRGFTSKTISPCKGSWPCWPKPRARRDPPRRSSPAWQGWPLPMTSGVGSRPPRPASRW